MDTEQEIKLRDIFAMAGLIGILANQNNAIVNGYEIDIDGARDTAADAYMLADAMLEAKFKTDGE